MEFEFDKEIDALLRQTARSETASANPNFQSKIRNPKSEIHLDADEIAAFAENALPEKIKSNYTTHFADCDRCRAILANIIALNSEAEIIPASSIVAPQTIETKAIPWYRKLFATPNLAYAMGALVVLFGGFFAFLVVQNLNNSPNSSEVSQISESRPAASGPSASDETDFSVSNSMSNMSLDSALSNSNAKTGSTSTMANSAASISSNAIAATPSAGQPASANSATTNNTNAGKKESSPDVTERGTTAALAKPQATAPTTNAPAESLAESQSTSSKQITALPQEDREQTKLTRTAPPSPVEDLPVNGRSANELKMARDKKAKSSADENDNNSRSLGGKNFTRKNNVWYDAAFSGQNTINVRRNSDDYRKLDSGLRSVADNLNGTVVIVWKGKAYRIQ